MTDIFRSEPSTSADQQPAGRDPRRWKALILLCVTNFMIILDAQIVILALPSIEKDLRLATGNGQWVLSAYLLAFGGLLLFGGRLADLRGRRRMFLLGTVLFLVSSLLCGMAWSASVLIGARVLQGISAAMMAPSALSILTNMFPDGAERNKALAYWSGVGGLGATAALLIGGSLTGSLGWQWIFYINLPVAAGMLVFGRVLLRESWDAAQPRAYDPTGALTITFGLMLLIATIVQGPTVGWASAPVLGMLLGAVILLGLFVIVESRSAAPLVPLRLFRSRLFVGGNLTIALITMNAWGFSFTVSAYAQNVLGYSPLRFGLGIIAMTLMTIVGAYAAQAGMNKVGISTVAAISMVMMGVGSSLLSQVSTDGSYFHHLLPGLLLFGLGVGGGPVAAFSAALSSVDEREAGVGSAITTTFFQIGAALGTAIVASVVISWVGGSFLPMILTQGYRAGFITCIVIAVIGLVVALILLRPHRQH